MAVQQTGLLTLTSGVALEAFRNVKMSSGTLVYADAGEQGIGITIDKVAIDMPVTVRLLNFGGTLKVTAKTSFALEATLYAAADGKVDDVSSGSAIGIAMKAATADNDIIEMMPFDVLSTTAATVSIADSGNFTSETTVEAALAEIYQHVQSTQSHIGISLTDCREVASNEIPDVTDTPATNDLYGGLLHAGSSPTLLYANGDTDSGLLITWATGDVTSIVFQRALPARFNPAFELALHIRTKGADGTAFTIDAYFNEGDTKVSDTSAVTTGSFSEIVAIIDASDIPAGAQTVTIEITPGTHAAAVTIISALSLEWKSQMLQS